ncbi:hypothetical protein BofuT4_P108390.1 [Botrytis cinerea T4]|uniref:Uncharacterized protein n=1 Tax=Botryotinia fuckeliana (strain T4) TaxID=999810 RepID=G2Y753_BOTF4|nr:hypothetical protein BofuT4_P108390.1 [Botrytis cinerea T4]
MGQRTYSMHAFYKYCTKLPEKTCEPRFPTLLCLETRLHPTPSHAHHIFIFSMALLRQRAICRTGVPFFL